MLQSVLFSYNPEFKTKAIKEYKKGKSPSQIFIEHGFNLEIIGKEKPKRCLQRWRDTLKGLVEEGFLNAVEKERCPSSKAQSAEDQLRKAEARIKFLETENDFLKKLEELERRALKKKSFSLQLRSSI
ncbi:hypothetical protein N9I19_01850 [Peribacillus sp. CSMR9]|nr:hypothetical protein [Peribacillus sp. CSMR9]